MNKYILTQGVGRGKNILTSFDNALLNSGIANYNLIKVSSILPSNSDKKDKIELEEGSLLPTAYAYYSTEQKNITISAAVAVGIPADNSKIGVIMEFSGLCSKQEAEKTVKAMVTESMDFRKYEIKTIEVISSEAYSDGSCFVTAFAGIAMW